MAMLPNPPEWELYDLDADPWQFHNLAADPARAATLQRMQGLLLEWRQETRDPFLDPTVLAAKHAAMKKLPKDAAADIESPVRKP
jgi:N-sulfoglucosamine sulfohydrolase